jgi:uncharacterized integral membrane protein
MMEQCRETVEAIRLPKPDWRTFAWGLLLLILVVFIVRNWAPLRINLFGWYIDAPRAVVLAIFFAFGMVTTWLIEVRNRRARGSDESTDTEEKREPAYVWEEADAEQDVQPTETQPEEFEEASDDFGEDEDADDRDGEEVQPEPEAFAEPEEADEEDDLGDGSEMAENDEAEDAGDAPVDQYEAPQAIEDETVGDAFTDEYGMNEMKEAPDPSNVVQNDADEPDEDGRDADADVPEHDEQQLGGNGADDASSEEDDAGKPFWRM